MVVSGSTQQHQAVVGLEVATEMQEAVGTQATLRHFLMALQLGQLLVILTLVTVVVALVTEVVALVMVVAGMLGKS